MSTLPVTVSTLKPAAKPPVAAPAATGVALVVALALIALGVVAARDVLINVGLIAGSPWIINALNYIDGLTTQFWMVPAGVAVGVLGLLLLLAAVKPRRRTHQQLRSGDTWVGNRDVIRLACGAAQPVTGVGTTVAKGSPRKVTLTITPSGGYAANTVNAAADAAITAALDPMARPPRVRIRIKEQDLP